MWVQFPAFGPLPGGVDDTNLPNNTGHAPPSDPSSDTVSTPIPEPAWPDVLENRKVLEEAEGPPPAGMIRPHAHHILPQKGIGPRQQDLVAEGQEILEKHGIDPIGGVENLTWAPNVKGQHVTENVEALVEDLRATDERDGADREDIVVVLERHGEEAASR